MDILSTILIIYGVLVLVIALLKLKVVWNMKKLQVMKKIFGGDTHLQVFLIIWALIALVVGILIR